MAVADQIRTILDREPPAALDELLAWARFMGRTPAEGAVDPDLHPLVMPLWQEEDGVWVGLLHWPTPQVGEPVPVVAAQGAHLWLRAPDPASAIAQEAAALDAAGRWTEAHTDAVGAHYLPGDVARLRRGLEAWVVLKGGGSPEAYEVLMQRHLERGDLRSALVTAERVAQRFPGWGIGQRWRFGILHRLSDRVQARDAARAALQLPLWTLGADPAPLGRDIGWTDPIDGSTYAKLAADPERLPADRAAYVMDAAVLDGTPWSATRETLAALYDEAGLEALARWIRRPLQA